MHWIFVRRKYVRPHTAQQCSSGYSPPAVITAPCDAPFNIPLYHSAQLPLRLTGKAESAQITRRQEIQLCQGFYIFIYVSLHRIIFSIHFPMIYAIWWALTHITRSYLYECMANTEACVTSQWGHKHTNDISRTALRVTSWAFRHLIWVKLSSSYTHRNVKVFTATRQNKSWIFEDIAAEIFVQQNVNNTTTKIKKTYFFKEWSHNISNMF